MASRPENVAPRPVDNSRAAASNARVQDVCRFIESMFSQRARYDSLFEDLASIFLPNRQGFLETMTPGEDRNFELFDSTPQLAARGLATAIGPLLRPPQSRYFNIISTDREAMMDPEVRAHMEQRTRILFDAIYDPRARFEEKATETDHDLAVLGTGLLFSGWEPKGEHLTFQSVPLNKAAVSLGKGQFIDALAVRKAMTVRQMIAEFGEEAMPEKVLSRLKDGNTAQTLNEPYQVTHLVMPNEDYKRFGLGPNRLPFVSMWVIDKEKHVLSESGFYEFPYSTPRWDTSSQEPYGRSPGMIALADAKTANAVARTLLEAGEKAVNPPLMAPADFIRGDIELFAGGLTLYDGAQFAYQGQPITPVELGKNMPLGHEMLAQTREQVFAAFFRDVLELPNRPDITAAEINARQDQFLRQAAPIFNRLEADYNSSIIRRCHAILQREGKFPDPPQRLLDSGARFEIVYETPIREARERATARRSVEAIMTTMQMVDLSPAMAENVDWDLASRDIMTALGLPEGLLKDPEAVSQAREEMQQQQAQKQQIEQAQMGAGALKDVAQADASSEGGLSDALSTLPGLLN
jgi:hypothetical protein